MSHAPEKSPVESPPSRGGRPAWLATVAAVLEDAAPLPVDLPAAAELDPDQVVSLGGGADAATYLVKGRGEDVVVKLDGTGLAAESQALERWRSFSSRVAKVLALGSVQSSDAERTTSYLVLAGMRNDDGQLVETAADLLEREPARAREVGQALGAELHALHQATGGPGFGNFADSPGSARTYDSWGDYLGDFLRHKAAFLGQIGVREDDIRAVELFMRGCPSVAPGVYLHGDVSVRNVAVLRYQPLAVGLFDPNPLIGDPSWDIAPMVNNAAFNEVRRARDGTPPETLQRDRDLVEGFWDGYPDRPDERCMVAAQLLQATLQSEHRHDQVAAGEMEPGEFEVARQYVVDLVQRVTR